MNGWNGPGTSTPTIADLGILDPGNNLHCFVPSIAVHPNGLAAVTYNATSASQRLSIYSNIKCNHLTAFNSAVLRYIHNADLPFSPVEITIGNTDYSGTVEDPIVPGRFWLHHGLAGHPSISLGSIVMSFEGCGADFTGDGFANGSDVAAFGSLFSASAPEVDFIPDETIDSDDFLEYLQIGLP